MLFLDEIKLLLNMFLFLCKLFLLKLNFKDYGLIFFILLVLCILDELDKMRIEFNEFYVFLVLLVVN